MARAHHHARKAQRQLLVEQRAERQRLIDEGKLKPEVEYPPVSVFADAMARALDSFWWLLPDNPTILLASAHERWFKAYFDPKYWPGHSNPRTHPPASESPAVPKGAPASLSPPLGGDSREGAP